MSLQHHILLGPEHLEGNGGLGRYVLVPGDPGRADRIATHLKDVEKRGNPRGHHAHLGHLEDDVEGGPVDVLVISSGMGSGSSEIILQELLACGARRLVRVGSCGSMTEAIAPGQVVIATGAVRDERTTHDYAPPEFPALAHPAAVEALRAGARSEGLAEETFLGICHSKASFYAREFGHGPAGKANLEYCAWLRRCGVVASEMEASTLFVLAAAASGPPAPIGGSAPSDCQAGAVLAVYATDDPERDFAPALAVESERKAIRVALAGVSVWAARDRSGG
ncbi:MAG: hypothetical protein OES47_07290 [Acidobacteriota bacterium]|nr:hypothetical protein [Acidobacteriota bacterium]